MTYQASKKTDFTVDLILRLAPIIDVFMDTTYVEMFVRDGPIPVSVWVSVPIPVIIRNIDIGNLA